MIVIASAMGRRVNRNGISSHQLFGCELVQVMPSGEGREDAKLANEPHLGAVIIDDGSAGNMSG